MKIKTNGLSDGSGLAIIILVLTAMIFYSCRKGEDEIKPALSNVMFIHASPGLAPIDIFIEGNRINGDRTISYTDTIPYKVNPSGMQTFTVKRQISSVTFVSKAYLLKKDKYYTFFVTGRPDSVTHVITEDKLVTPSFGKAKLRFFNMSPDSKALDFKLSPSAALFTNVPFKCGGEFESVEPGKYTSAIFDKGGSIILAQVPMDIEAGKFYTVWARGMKSSADPGTALSMQVISKE